MEKRDSPWTLTLFANAIANACRNNALGHWAPGSRVSSNYRVALSSKGPALSVLLFLTRPLSSTCTTGLQCSLSVPVFRFGVRPPLGSTCPHHRIALHCTQLPFSNCLPRDLHHHQPNLPISMKEQYISHLSLPPNSPARYLYAKRV